MRYPFVIKKSAYAEIDASFICPHLDRELRLRYNKDGRPTYVRQCIVCGHTSSPIAAKVAKQELGAVNSAPPYNHELQPKWFARKNAAYLQTYKEIQPQMKSEYDAYLKSTAWRERRQPILERAEGICEVCEYFPSTEVHHLTYVRIGAELDEDLLAVCDFCHSLLHNKKS